MTEIKPKEARFISAPTMYILHWKISAMCFYRSDMENIESQELKSPIFDGIGKSKFQLCIAFNSVHMTWILDNFSLNVKGTIYVKDGKKNYFDFLFESGNIKLTLLSLINLPLVNTDMEISCEFIAWPIYSNYESICETRFSRNSADNADISIIVGEKTFSCHKALLSSQSIELDSLISDKENINLNCCQNSFAFEGLLDCIYGKSPHDIISEYTFDVIKVILELGETLQVALTKHLCVVRTLELYTTCNSYDFVWEIECKQLLSLKPRQEIISRIFAFCGQQWCLKVHNEITGGNELVKIYLIKMTQVKEICVEICIAIRNHNGELLEKIPCEIEFGKEENRKLLPRVLNMTFLQRKLKPKSKNKLSICCKLKSKLYKHTKKSNTNAQEGLPFQYIKSYRRDYTCSIEHMYKNSICSDLTIKVCDNMGRKSKIIFGHKFVLAQRSEYFKSLIDKAENNSIEIKVSPLIYCNIDETMLLIYTNKADFSRALEALEIYTFSNVYKLEDLKGKASKVLLREENLECNAERIRKEAEKFKDKVFIKSINRKMLFYKRMEYETSKLSKSISQNC